MQKSTVDEIRERFDSDVERFSNLQSGQSATIDAPLVLELITTAAAESSPGATKVPLPSSAIQSGRSMRPASIVAALIQPPWNPTETSNGVETWPAGGYK